MLTSAKCNTQQHNNISIPAALDFCVLGDGNDIHFAMYVYIQQASINSLKYLTHKGYFSSNETGLTQFLLNQETNQPLWYIMDN